MTTSLTGMAIYQSVNQPRSSRVSYHMSLLTAEAKSRCPRQVDVDTGSSELYISSSSCDRSCNHHNLYEASKSSTAHDLKSQFSLQYSDGSTISGTLYTDDVTIAHYTVGFVHFAHVFPMTCSSLRQRNNYSAALPISTETSTVLSLFQMEYSAWHSRKYRVTVLLSSRPLPPKVPCLAIPLGCISARITQSCTSLEVTTNFTRATSLMWMLPKWYRCAERYFNSVLTFIRCRATGKPSSRLSMSTGQRLLALRMWSSTVAVR